MEIGDDVVINGKTYSIKTGIELSCRGCSFCDTANDCNICGEEWEKYGDFCVNHNAIYVEKEPSKDLSNDELINELRSRGFKGTIELETTIIKKYEL